MQLIFSYFCICNWDICFKSINKQLFQLIFCISFCLTILLYYYFRCFCKPVPRVIERPFDHPLHIAPFCETPTNIHYLKLATGRFKFTSFKIKCYKHHKHT